MNGQRVHGRFTPYLFLLPALAVLGVFVAGSFVQAAYYSLTRYTAFAPARWVGLENYRRLVSDDRFWACLGNSFLYLLVTPALVVLSLWAAMVVRSGIRGHRGLRLALFLPVVTPTIVAAIAWRLLLAGDGLANQALEAIGLDPVGWLTRRPWTLISPMLVTLWKGFGFYMMIFLAGLLTVPRELEEAAEVDGAGRWGVFRHVVLPSILPVMVLVVVISSISAMKVFDELFVTVRGVPVEHQTAVPLIYYWAVEVGDYGQASALGMALFVVILSMSLVNLRLSRRGGEAER
ncbi:MAG: carbohydrate ABC transporter permease [Phycisphaerales bacterium]